MAVPVTREGALQPKARKLEAFEVPDWGGTVWIRRLSAREQVEVTEAKGLKGFSKVPEALRVPVYVIIRTVATEDGEPLFTLEDAAALADVDAQVLTTVFAKAAKINGLTTKELEEAVADFARTQADGDSSTA